MATLEEIERHWSINDLMDAHDALDMEIEMGQIESDRTKAEADRKK